MRGSAGRVTSPSRSWIAPSRRSIRHRVIRGLRLAGGWLEPYHWASTKGALPVEFSVLGPLSVRADGKESAIGGTKPRALLCLLLINVSGVVSAHRLIEDLWEGPPESAAGTLQSHISTLRRAIRHDRLQTRGRGYLLAVDEGELDANSFEAEIAEARRNLAGGGPAKAVEVLTRALVHWRGPALGEVARASWAVAEGARLEEQRLIALEALLEARLSLGHAADVECRAEALGHLVAHAPSGLIEQLGQRRRGDLARLVPSLADRSGAIAPTVGR